VLQRASANDRSGHDAAIQTAKIMMCGQGG
jgi:hypothetical protein